MTDATPTATQAQLVSAAVAQFNGGHIDGATLLDLVNEVLPQGLSPWIVAQIRTGVPMAVGFAVTALDHELARRYGWAPKIDTPTVAGYVTAAVGFFYYVAVRHLESWKPALGKLLGYPAAPKY